MQIDSTDTSCTAIRASITGVSGTVHKFTFNSASQPAPQTQSGTAYSVFSSIIPGSYTLNSQAPVGYVFARGCWASTNAGTSGEAITGILASGDTLTWDLGYTLGIAWSQTRGGDVYASATLQSYVPAATTFILDGTGGYPGVATYGSDYNFDSSGVTHGQAWVSSKNWLVNDTVTPTVDYYQFFYRQFGGAPAIIDFTNPDLGSAAAPILITQAQAPSRATPYYVNGNMETSGNWNVGDGQNIVFFVNGNLTIGGNINITGTGFVSFIVNGNITVASTVGEPYTTNPATPVVEGIYITSPTGTFITGSSGSGTERFVGKGMFIAGNFNLGRDLGTAGNPTTSSELFIYNPQLLLTMPDQMKQSTVSWQEVAP
jgi:hypothetical protein